MVHYGIELARRNGIKLPFLLTYRGYNSVVRRALLPKIGELQEELKVLDMQWRQEKDMAERQRKLVAYTRTWNMFMILYAIASELKTHSIFAASYW